MTAIARRGVGHGKLEDEGGPLQMAEVAVPQELFRRILYRIDGMRAPTLARC